MVATERPTADTLAPEQYARLACHVPRDDDQLHRWIELVCGLSIPRVAVCTELGHCAPFDWIADLFFERVTDALIIASRSGGKTWGTAALGYAEALLKACEVAQVGAIELQAQKCHGYQKRWMQRARQHEHVTSITRRCSEFRNGGKIEVVVGTMSGVNSPHPSKLTLDELDLMEWKIIQEAESMPQTAGRNLASTRATSTRKFADGSVQRLKDEAEERGIKVYEYCAIECAQPCTVDECESCKAIVRRDQENRKVSFYDICARKLPRSRGYLPIGDLKKKFRKLDVETFQTQWAPCSRPTRGDCCFTQFSDIHELADLTYDPEKPLGTGWDFGLDDMMVVLLYQWDPDGTVYVIDEIGSGELAPTPEQRERLVEDVGQELIDKYPRALESQSHWCGPDAKQRSKIDGKSCMSELRRLGLWLRYRKEPSPARRIRAIKRKLLINDTHNPPRPHLFVASRCKVLIRALRYAQWDRSVTASRETYKHDRHSHPLDALGYAIDGQWPEGGAGSVRAS